MCGIYSIPLACFAEQARHAGVGKRLILCTLSVIICNALSGGISQLTESHLAWLFMKRARAIRIIAETSRKIY